MAPSHRYRPALQSFQPGPQGPGQGRRRHLGPAPLGRPLPEISMSKMSRPLAFATASLVALSLMGCGQANADKAFGEKVHAYLIEHPEVLVEMSSKLQEK